MVQAWRQWINETYRAFASEDKQESWITLINSCYPSLFGQETGLFQNVIGLDDLAQSVL